MDQQQIHLKKRFLAFIVILVIHANIFDCAKDSGTFGRIVRGRNAKTDQFPYVVRIVMYIEKEPFLCGGALIGARWVLSAAHCFENVKSVEVHLGSIFRDRAKILHHVPISDIFVHPFYNRFTVCNDIALIKIPPSELSSKIAYAPLPKIKRPHPKYMGAYAIACGWGRILRIEIYPNRLQYGRLKILDSRDCGPGTVTKDQICTAISSTFATITLGDSGGPLVLESTGELVGIASLGDAKNSEYRQPAIFTRVTSYLVWIKSVSGIYY